MLNVYTNYINKNSTRCQVFWYWVIDYKNVVYFYELGIWLMISYEFLSLTAIS
jgi:hypothetical protein